MTFAIQCYLSTAITCLKCWVLDCKVTVQDDIHGTRVLRVDSATRMITASYAVVEWSAHAHAGWAVSPRWVVGVAGGGAPYSRAVAPIPTASPLSRKAALRSPPRSFPPPVFASIEFLFKSWQVWGHLFHFLFPGSGQGCCIVIIMS